MFKKLLARLALLLLAPVAPLAAVAADDKPMEWVVGYAAGGGSDVVARMLAEAMGKAMGRPIVVLNKPGGGANIAADYVAKSRDTQGTLMTADSAVLAANPFLYTKLSYDADKDFAPVGSIARFPLVLVVGPNVPAKNLRELITWVRSNAEGANYASPGTGSPHHLVTELFRQQTGLKLSHVPYRGAAPAIQDVIGGQVPLMFVDTSSGASFLASGKLRAIGVASAERLKSFADVPTLKEQGLADFEAYAWQALVVPSSTPSAFIGTLNKALVAALNTAAVKERFHTLGIEPMPSTAEELASYTRSERQRWGRVIREAAIKLD